MLNNTAIAADTATVSDILVAAGFSPVEPASTDAKPARKPRAPKAATPAPALVTLAPATPATPAPAAPSIADERHAAALAVGTFYTSGPSFPFKSASVKLSDINPNNAKAPSPRTGALVAAMLAYAGDNIKPDGTFMRGGFRVPATLINPDAKRGETLAAMPESGCLGNMLGRVVSHVSGPLGGKQARDAIFQLDFAAARIELQQLGDATAKPALAVLNKLAPVAKPAKRSAKA